MIKGEIITSFLNSAIYYFINRNAYDLVVRFELFDTTNEWLADQYKKKQSHLPLAEEVAFSVQMIFH
jgi:hypothetical protein